MKKTLLALAAASAVLAQAPWYQVAVSTNRISWSWTNLTEVPPQSAVYFMSGSGTKRVVVPGNSVIASNLWVGYPYGLFSVQVSPILASGTELLPSTNAFILWVPTPPLSLPGSAMNLIVK